MNYNLQVVYCMNFELSRALNPSNDYASVIPVRFGSGCRGSVCHHEEALPQVSIDALSDPMLVLNRFVYVQNTIGTRT